MLGSFPLCVQLRIRDFFAGLFVPSRLLWPRPYETIADDDTAVSAPPKTPAKAKESVTAITALKKSIFIFYPFCGPWPACR